jgi:hypothetical protein
MKNPQMLITEGTPVFAPYSPENPRVSFLGLGAKVGFVGLVTEHSRSSTNFAYKLIGSAIYKLDSGNPLLGCRIDGDEREEQRSNLETGRLTYNSQAGLWLFVDDFQIEFRTLKPIIGRERVISRLASLGTTAQLGKDAEELLDILKNSEALV